jgi:PAS domain S-box-containing protein
LNWKHQKPVEADGGVMKIEHKVIALSIIFVLFAWAIDALLDYFFFPGEESFGFEFYIRSYLMIVILTFGIIASRIIAKRNQAEEELLKFKMGIERSNEAMFLTDINGTIVYANPAFEKIYGYSREETLGKTPRILKSGTLPHEVYKQFWDTLLAKKVVTGEIINKTKDGRLLNTESSSNPILDKNGNVTGFLAIQHDVTERKLSEVALQESEERYRKLVEFSPDTIGIIREDKIAFFNATGAKLLGAVSPEQLIGKSVLDFVHPDYKEIVKERIRLMIEEGKNVSLIEEKLIKLDGSVIDAEAIAMPFTYQGKPGVQVIIRDITERKRAEEELRKSEECFRQISESAGEWIWEVDADGLYIYSNPVIEKILGYKPQEIVGKKHFYDLFAPDVREELKNTAFENFAMKESFRGFVNPNIHKNGNIVTLDTSGLPILDERGNLLGYRGTDTDITEHRRAEEALKQSEEKYHTLIDNIQDGVFMIQDAKIQFVNEAFAQMSGYTVEEVIGKDYRELVAPEDLEMVAERYQRRQAGEDVPREYEFQMLHKDGRTRILINMNVGLITYRGRVASMGTVKDITEKKKLESQLLLSQRMESVGTLASGIAHDINNVLTPIMLSQELLQERLTDEESKRLLNTIERSTQRGANLMKQVQSFAKGVEGERDALQVANLISEIREIAEETFPRSIEIRTDIPKDLWTISADATQLNQVIMNLCVNARDAMQDGGILSISAENLLIDEDYARINIEAKIGPYIVITISDTGKGIPPEVMNRIFEPFFSTKEHGKGTGLGLSISHGIVKSHGGFKTVYSEVGKGTAFKVYLPAIITIETLKAQEHQHELPAGHGESILVVDDEDQILEVTQKTLEKHGYKVTTANDGKEAISSYLQHRGEIKLVLMDMMMPVMDGTSCIRELRKVNPEVKIIAVSGLTEKDKLAKVDDAHVQAFLTKPYAAEKLLNAIYDIISSK